MNIVPVIERELRAQSRLPFTYYSRLMGVGVMLLAGLLFSLDNGFNPSMGGKLFSYLNCALFACIWILVPLLCADCISRERREGTVGLLFLTPLKARDVVMAKGLVHGLRAFSILLAVIPSLTIAFLLGGVSWVEATLAMMVNFSSVCWALAAGVLASSIGKSWVGSQLFACLFGLCFAFTFFMLTGFNLSWFTGRPVWIPFATYTSFDQVLLVGIMAATNLGQWWAHMFGRLPAATVKTWPIIEGRMVVFSVLFLFVAIRIAAVKLRRSWREEPPSARVIWLEKKFFTPVLMVSFFHNWMRRKLQRNPIGWLETRTWSGRLVTWGWFAVMISIYSAALNNSDVSRSLDLLQKFMAWLLLGIMAVSSSGSFQRERETGVLELLLVSPMSVGQIIGGRLRGLWGQFLPACVLLVAIWVYLSQIFHPRQSSMGLIQFFCGAFLTLPVIGLFYSLKRANFISAFLSTILVGLLIPFCISTVLNSAMGHFLGFNPYYLQNFAQEHDDDSWGNLLFYAVLRLTTSFLFLSLIQLLIAVWVGRRLYRDMEQRNFAFSRMLN